MKKSRNGWFQNSVNPPLWEPPVAIPVLCAWLCLPDDADADDDADDADADAADADDADAADAADDDDADADDADVDDDCWLAGVL